MAGLDARGRWHARLNARMYGAALAVPVGLTTRLSSDGAVREALETLAAGRVEVVEAGPEPVGKRTAAEPSEGTSAGVVSPGSSAPEPAGPRRTLFGTLGTVVSRAAKRPEPERSAAAPAPVEQPPAGPALPLRPTRPALRAEATRDAPATLGNAALNLDSAEDDGRRGRAAGAPDPVPPRQRGPGPGASGAQHGASDRPGRRRGRAAGDRRLRRRAGRRPGDRPRARRRPHPAGADASTSWPSGPGSGRT